VPLRIGFDLDGVLADFAAAYRAIDERLHGATAAPSRAGDPEDESDADEQRVAERGEREIDRASADGSRAASVKNAQSEHESRMGARRRRDAIWTSIQSTDDFWTTLKPIEEGAVARIRGMMLRHRWEVFFITQRPGTAGETVQRQTQRWLVEQGFDLPSVLVVPGSRGAAAAALSLDYHVDDSSKNCIDVKSESHARPLLIGDTSDETMSASARRLGIGVAASISEALDILEKATKARLEPSLLERVAKLVGWV
jgi:hypothetical protein